MENPVLLEAEQITSRCRALSQRVATLSNRLVGESDSLAVEIKSLQQSIRNSEKAAAQLQDTGVCASALEHLRTGRKIIEGLGPGGDLRKYCKPRNPLLLRLLLGGKVNVVTFRRDESVALKEEYYSFRDTSVLLMVGATSLLSFAMWRAEDVRQATGGYTLKPWLMTGVQLFLAWLGYFYLALALRENVLLVNGSHIRPWWIQHHYWSAAASLLLLGLPIHSPMVYSFMRSFMLWSCFQALVMLLQNRYQRRRMYTRIALGKNSAMDVVTGEGTGSTGLLFMLYPLLVVLQVWQFAIGTGIALSTYSSLFTWEGWLEVEPLESDLRGMRGMCLVGLVFAVMALRNFFHTVESIREKTYYTRVKRKRSSHHHALAAAAAAEADAEEEEAAAKKPL